jgi:hypothetical protein
MSITNDSLIHVDSLHSAFGYVPKRAIQFFTDPENNASSLLLEELEEVLDAPQEFAEEGSQLLYYGALILAALKEERGCEIVRRIGSLSQEMMDAFFGERLYDSFALAAAHLFENNLAALKEIVLNDEMNDLLRSSAIQAMMYLYGRGFIQRDELVPFLLDFLKQASSLTYCYEVIAAASLALHPDELIEALRSLYQQGKIDAEALPLQDLEETLALPKEETIAYGKDALNCELKSLIAHLESIPDFCFGIERNDPCPCGSGAKFKKCCI